MPFTLALLLAAVWLHLPWSVTYHLVCAFRRAKRSALWDPVDNTYRRLDQVRSRAWESAGRGPRVRERGGAAAAGARALAPPARPTWRTGAMLTGDMSAFAIARSLACDSA